MHQRTGESNEDYRIRCNIYLAGWRVRNPEKQAAINRRSIEKNWDKVQASKKKRREEKKEEISAYQSQYWQDNKVELGKYRRDWAREKFKTDIGFRILTNLRQRLKSAIKRKHQRKAPKTTELIGCSAQFLKGYLEAKFEPWMSWANYGEWEIDHIIPCSKFDLTDARQQLVCFHYTNLQPLRKRENQSKGNKIIQFKAA
jgi:hypothetical protein